MTSAFIEHIEAYLHGNLSREELQRLALAEGIQDLDAEIEWVRDMTLAIETEGLKQHLSATLPDPAQLDKSLRGDRLRKLRIPIALAASIVILIVVYFGQQRSEEQLYRRFAYQDPGLPLRMSQSATYAHDLLQ